ncbi:MAG: ATP-dependent Clp protease ATP-binding subunit [Patescibacteria group bacterium]|jgi:ATP-dependent Clp protease ATP-binding subunit ClpC
MADNKQNISHFYPIVCSFCQGRGCDSCGELGIAYWYTNLNSQKKEEYFLYWGETIDWQNIARRTMEKFFTKAVNIVLLIFGAVGLLLGLWVYGEPIASGEILKITLNPFSYYFHGWPNLRGDGKVVLFWISILVDSYLFYRLEIANSKKISIIKKVFDDQAVKAKNFISPSVPTWAQLLDGKDVQIDISRNYSPDAIRALEQAWRIAKNWHHPEVLPIHLLAGSLSSHKTNVIFSRLGTDGEKLMKGIKEAMAKISPAISGQPVLSSTVKNVIFRAYEQAYLFRQEQVTVAELLIAIDQEKNIASDLLYQLDIDLNKIRNVVVWLQINERLYQQWKRHHRLGKRRPKGDVNKAYTAVMTPFLDAFSVDLTRQAVYGLFPPNIGREDEIQEVLRIIEGGNNSVVLVGQHGVGKTAIIEDIAQRMIADEVPKVMQDKRLVTLSIPKITAGVSAAGASERLLSIFNEMQRSGNIILVIEDVDQLLGISTGGQESLDLSDALANYLSKTGSVAITTTTPQGYSSVESAGVLSSVLHKVVVEEPTGDLAIQIVESRVGSIEAQTKIYFSYDAIVSAVELSARYIHDRYLPAKALDVLKETAVYVAQSRGQKSAVLGEDVATIVSQKTSIPLTKISEEESEKLVGLEQEIHQRMVDQEEAVKEVAAALRRARAGMREGTRPIANFLFLGPTGVGKTELAKTIAAVYFGNEDLMIRVDMSEYQTKESLYRLIGAPTGQKSGGLLTEAVRNNPFSLILFDEIEKAHSDILNLFLQVMDDGRLTDNAGRTVDFTNTIVIMTSNAGTKYIQDQVKTGVDIEQIKNDLVDNQLNQFFKPEFLNRFDAINVFKPLTIKEVIQIANLMTKKIANNLLKEGVVLEVTPAAIEELAWAGFDPQFGARPLRRVIQEKLANALANMKIQNQFKRGSKIIYDIGGKIRVTDE